MHLSSLSLENFRNVESANLLFASKRIFFLGLNGQGKTNVLEAIGLSSTLRSFRKSGLEGLVKHGQKKSRLFYQFTHDKGEQIETLLEFQDKGEKMLEVDGERIKRFTDYLGSFPSVSLSSRDFRLIRDGPSERRRWLDSLLSSSSSEYFNALKIYHRSLRERNALLKNGGSDRELDAFEQSLIPNAYLLFNLRNQALPKLSESLVNYYYSLAGGKEEVSLCYRPNFEMINADDFAQKLTFNRMRDRQLGNTRLGPHRDDFDFLLDGKDARVFASEGQQRGFILSLRLAEYDYLKNATKRTPILLADDVLGELDDRRKANFKKLLPSDAQVFATGTSLPTNEEKDEWEIFDVNDGCFSQNESAL